MSRSYKKNPILKYGGLGSVWAKKQANKTTRRYLKRMLDEAPTKGTWHRKIYCSYHIYDIISRCTMEQYIDIRFRWFGEDADKHKWARWYYYK